MKTIAVLAGAFNPITRAHAALIDAGRKAAEEVVCVIPRVYPHKSFEGASLADRIAMVRQVGAHVEITEGGLFLEIARELRRSRPRARIEFLCGRDAAERIIGWDYGTPGMAERMLDEFGLLVAARQGEFIAPGHLRDRVRALRLDGGFDDVSSTEVRRRIAAGEDWEPLVPEPVIELVRRIYAAAP